MRKLKICLMALVIGTAGSLTAQNSGTMKSTSTTTTTTTSLPDWGVVGSEKAHYYYIPDIEAFYDINGKQFVYMDNGKMVKSADLPSAYKDYDLYNGYKVVMNDDKEPFADYDKIKMKYAKGYTGEPQKTVKIKKRANGTVKIKEK